MRELQTTTPEGITIGDLLGEELYPIYDVEKIVQSSFGKRLHEKAPRFFGNQKVDLFDTDYYKSAASLSVIIAGLLICFVIVLLVLNCVFRCKAPWSAIRTHRLLPLRISALVMCSLAVVSLSLLVHYGLFGLQDALTLSQNDVSLMNNVLNFFQSRLDSVELELNETAVLQVNMTLCAPDASEEINDAFGFVDTAVSLLSDATDVRKYASSLVNQLKLEDDINDKMDKFFKYAWISIVIVISFIVLLMVSIILAMEGNLSKKWVRNTSSYFLLPVLNILFVVCFAITVAFCFSSVVIADVCDDPNALILTLAKDPDVGNINDADAENMDYYFTCPPRENNTTKFLGEAITEVEAGADEMPGISGYIEATNPTATCLSTVDDFVTNLNQGIYFLKVLYSVVSCQALYKIYHQIVNDTVCNATNAAIAWCWTTFFCTSFLILMINLLRYSWQLNGDELLLYFGISDVDVDDLIDDDLKLQTNDHYEPSDIDDPPQDDGSHEPIRAVTGTEAEVVSVV